MTTTLPEKMSVIEISKPGGPEVLTIANRTVPEPKPDDRLDTTLRPQSLSDLIGQEQVKENLAILIAAARQRDGTGRAMDRENSPRLSPVVGAPGNRPPALACRH